MKKLYIFILISLFSGSAFCQYPLDKGQVQLNAGFGLSGWGKPVYIGLDFGVHKDMSLGLELSYRKYRARWDKMYFDHSITGISGNWNYHFNSVLDLDDQWDFYAGLNCGWYIWRSEAAYYGTDNTGLGLGAQIGGRYYFNDKIGINLEAGGGNAFSGGKLGITVKF